MTNSQMFDGKMLNYRYLVNVIREDVDKYNKSYNKVLKKTCIITYKLYNIQRRE